MRDMTIENVAQVLEEKKLWNERIKNLEARLKTLRRRKKILKSKITRLEKYIANREERPMKEVTGTPVQSGYNTHILR